MRRFIYVGMFLLLFLFQNQLFSQVTPEKLKREGLEIGFKFPQSFNVLKEERERLFEINPLKTIPLTTTSYRVACNSNYCAFSLRDGKVIIYDLKRESIVVNKKFSGGPIYSVGFHPSKNIACFGERDGRVTIFDIDNKAVIHAIYELGKPVSDAEFSPDGTTLAVAYLGKGEISLYSAENYEILRSITPHEAGIYSINFSPDASLIAAGSRDKNVSVTSLKEEGLPTQLLREHRFLVLSLDFSENNDFLASGAGDCQLVVRQKRENLIATKPYFKWVHGDWVTAVKFFKDYLLTGSKDGRIRIFDFRSRQLLGDFKAGEHILSLDVTPDGKYLFAASEQILIYDFRKIAEIVGPATKASESELKGPGIITVSGRLKLIPKKEEDWLTLYGQDAKAYYIKGEPEFIERLTNLLAELGENNLVTLTGTQDGTYNISCHNVYKFDPDGNKTTESKCIRYYILDAAKIEEAIESDEEIPPPQRDQAEELKAKQAALSYTQQQAMMRQIIPIRGGKIESLNIRSPIKTMRVSFRDKDNKLINKTLLLTSNTVIAKKSLEGEEPMHLSVNSLQIGQKVSVEYVQDERKNEALFVTIIKE